MAKKGGNPQNFNNPAVKTFADKPLTVRVEIKLDEWVRSLPNKNEWLREAIAEKYEREQAQKQPS